MIAIENDFSKKIIHHNKLVRDNIPDIIRKNGHIPFTTTLNESADILEVIYSILDFYNTSLETMEAIRKERLAKNGGFNDKIFLEYTK